MARTFQVTFDAHDPPSLCAFWAEALGYVLQPPPTGYESWEAWAAEVGIPEDAFGDRAACVDPDGVGPRLFFQRVPEPKTAKNRVHLDLNVGTGLEGDDRKEAIRAEADRLVGLGASEIETFDTGMEFWIVMADPEGNEFCVH